MAAFRPSAHALKRAAAAFGEERVPILRLNMAAEHVQATSRKHATRNHAKVRHDIACPILSWLVGWLFHGWLTRLVSHLHPITRQGIHALMTHYSCMHIRVSSCAWRLFRLRRML